MARAVNDSDVFRRVVRWYWREEHRTMRLMAAVLGEDAGKVPYKHARPKGMRRRVLTYGEAMMYTYWMEVSS